jgi:hypothetical protein
MQATECIADVRNMMIVTGGRMVNHAYASWSSEKKLGLVDFLDCMGVKDARKKDVKASNQRINTTIQGGSLQEAMQIASQRGSPGHHQQVAARAQEMKDRHEVKLLTIVPALA